MANVSSSNSQGVRVPKLRFPGFEGEWECVQFSELFTHLSNNTLSRAELSNSGEIRNIHYGDVLIKYGDVIDIDHIDVPYVTDAASLKKPDYLYTGDVVISDTAEDETVGKAVEIINFSRAAIVSGLHTIPCRPKRQFISSYLGYYINSTPFHTQLLPYMQGIKVTSISKGNVGKTHITFPTLDEQQKITGMLNLLSSRIEKQKQLVEALKSYKRGLLSKLFPKNGENTPQYRFAGFTEPWKQRKIKELFKITRGYVLAASMTTDKQTESTPYPVYSSQTKNDGLMGYYNQYLYENAITWTTDGANAGTVNFRDGKFYCTNVCGVLLADAVAPDQMISQALNSVAKNHVSYVGNPKLMNNVMADITISLPECEKERQVISSILSYYDNLISSHRQKLDGLQSLKAGLLQQLFI